MPNTMLNVLENAHQPVRKAIRRLRWFIDSFQEQTRQISAETGVKYDIDDARLAAVFLDWLRAFETQKPDAPESRRPFVGFAAGLMLRTLLRHQPVSVAACPDDADASNPAYFWPEGYLYVAYCLNIRSAVLEQDFHEDRRTVPELAEIRTWWSFRENVAEDPALSIAFLDLFAGEDPDWAMPDVFRNDGVARLASRFYEMKVTDDR